MKFLNTLICFFENAGLKLKMNRTLLI